MRHRSPRSLLILALALGAIAGTTRCACDGDDGGGDGAGGSPPPAKSEPTCAWDLTSHLGDGSGAVAREITQESDLIGGEAASGRTGDFLLANEKVRFVIEGARREIGAQPYGGNPIDADVVRPAGEPGQDVLGEIGAFYNFGRTTDPAERGDVFVLRDGSDGGAAVIAVNGRDTQNDFLYVNGLISTLVAGQKFIVDSEAELPVRTTTYHVLPPGAQGLTTITAMCNQSTGPLALAIGDLVDSGGRVEQYNPHSATKGFGYQSLPNDFPWTAWVGRGSTYALVPEDGGGRNQSLTISGVTGTLQGGESLFDFLTSDSSNDRIDPAAPPKGALVLPPRGSGAWVRRLLVGRTLSEVTDAIFTLQGAQTGRVAGVVTDGGAPVANARVAALRNRELPGGGRRDVGETVFQTDATGHFAGSLPVGSYELSANLPGLTGASQRVEIAAGAEASANLSLPDSGELVVRVEDLAGAPLPGQVHVLCDPCLQPRAEEIHHRDVVFDEWDPGTIAVAHAGVDGAVRFRLPVGTYRVLVSRGLEYGTFPADWWRTRQGHEVTLAAAETSTVRAPLARVVDTTGWVSADFHVHAINSPDSPVPNEERVLSFLAGNVEVLVATDHDFVTDYAPYVEALQAGALIKSVIGEEVTTFNFGHFNAFPLTIDPSMKNGGAVDWAGGRDATLRPQQIFDAARARGAVVLQMNHPRGALGHLDALRVDTATFASHAAPQTFRMSPDGADPAIDSKLFSADFTAMELLNGADATRRSFEPLLNDWFTFLSRGFVVTGTAVSDTHTWAAKGPGSPVSWVKVGLDAPADVDPAALAVAVNEHKVVGSLGPFLDVTATAGANAAGIGETIATGGAGNELALHVVVQSPAWIEWNRVEVYSFATGREAVNGLSNSTFPEDGVATQADGTPARLAVDVADPALIEDGHEGGAAHQRRVVDHTFRFTPQADTWYVVVVRTLTANLPDGETVPRDLAPIAIDSGGKGAPALGFANPILVDVDGGGYDAFPLRGLARTGERPAERERPIQLQGRPTMEQFDRFIRIADPHLGGGHEHD